jgi:hypothetical protein
VRAVQLHEPLRRGLGVRAGADYSAAAARRLADIGYAGLAELI